MVANLEDLVTDLRKKCERMEETFAQYLDQREAHRHLIENFDDDMAVLHQVLLHCWGKGAIICEYALTLEVKMSCVANSYR